MSANRESLPEPPKPALVWMTEHQRECSLGKHERDEDAKFVVQSRDSESAGSYIYIEWRSTRKQRGLSLCRHCNAVFAEKDA